MPSYLYISMSLSLKDHW